MEQNKKLGADYGVGPTVYFTTSVWTRGRERRKIRMARLSMMKRFLMVGDSIYGPALEGFVHCWNSYRQAKDYKSADLIRDFLKLCQIEVRSGRERDIVVTTLPIIYKYPLKYRHCLKTHKS